MSKTPFHIWASGVLVNGYPDDLFKPYAANDVLRVEWVLLVYLVSRCEIPQEHQEDMARALMMRAGILMEIDSSRSDVESWIEVFAPAIAAVKGSKTALSVYKKAPTAAGKRNLLKLAKAAKRLEQGEEIGKAATPGKRRAIRWSLVDDPGTGAHLLR